MYEVFERKIYKEKKIVFGKMLISTQNSILHGGADHADEDDCNLQLAETLPETKKQMEKRDAGGQKISKTTLVNYISSKRRGWTKDFEEKFDN